MSKQPKLAKSTPELYTGLDTTRDLKAHITEDVHFGFYVFDRREACHILKEAIQKQWDGITTFLDLPKQTLLTYHENLFKDNPPKDQDLTLTAQYCWAKIVSIAVDRRSSSVPVSASGRKSTIGLCKYALGPVSTVPVKFPPQAKTCYTFVAEMIAKITTDDKTVTEADLRQYTINNATRLATRQDPWRIFQYYRPLLINERLITRN